MLVQFQLITVCIWETLAGLSGERLNLWVCYHCFLVEPSKGDYSQCFTLSPIRLSPRYQPIWTIYIPFESPWLIDFRNARFDLDFWRYVMPCGAMLCKLVFSGGITAWEQRHTRKTIWLKIFPNLLFYQFISKLFASNSTYVIYRWLNVLEKI